MNKKKKVKKRKKLAKKYPAILISKRNWEKPDNFNEPDRDDNY